MILFWARTFLKRLIRILVIKFYLAHIPIQDAPLPFWPQYREGILSILYPHQLHLQVFLINGDLLFALILNFINK